MSEKHKRALARSGLYELLSLAFLYPEGERATLLAEAAQKMAPVASDLGWHDVESTLKEVSDSLGSMGDEALLKEYAELFGHTLSPDCPPYEAEYGQAHIFQKSQTLADLNTFYEAFGVAPNPELRERPDHISVEMEFMHILTLKEAYARLHGHGEDKVLMCREAQRSFLANHLSTWINGFAHRLAQKAGEGSSYALLACLLERYVDGELKSFRLDPLKTGPSPMPFEEEGEACPLINNT